MKSSVCLFHLLLCMYKSLLATNLIVLKSLFVYLEMMPHLCRKCICGLSSSATYMCVCVLLNRFLRPGPHTGTSRMGKNNKTMHHIWWSSILRHKMAVVRLLWQFKFRFPQNHHLEWLIIATISTTTTATNNNKKKRLYCCCCCCCCCFLQVLSHDSNYCMYA